ncbi:MAG: NFACT family protein [Defluviitaleaceae bacterium]|nr:NFACT family protein [Defluviitaleaceae bacterium]
MPLDGIVLSSVVHELSTSLTGGRVDKVQQPEPDEILLAVRCKGQNYKLLLTTNANSPRIHLTALSKSNPDQAPMFCMLLRKHLGGGRIKDIIQPAYERIVEIHVESPNEMGDMSIKRLIIEIMGKHSNIMLVDATGMIMDSIRHIPEELSSVREIMPGRSYILPPSQGKVSPTPIDSNYFMSLFEFKKEEPNPNKGKKAQQIIYQSYNGISPVMGSEICLRANVSPDSFGEALESLDCSHLLSEFTSLYSDIENKIYHCHMYEENNKIGKSKRDISAVPMTLYSSWTKSELYDSPSKMLEFFYKKQDSSYRLSQKTADLRKLITMHIERCRRKTQIYEETLYEIENRDQLKHYGELITSYIYNIPAGADRVKLPDFYSDGQEIEISLDPTLSPSDNAQYYFKRYNKAKRTFAALQEQIETNKNELAYLDSVLACIGTVTDETDIDDIRTELVEEGFLKKKQQKGKGKKGLAKQKSKPLQYLSAEGFSIYVGKNNTQNDELTLRFARENDIWLHTKDIAGSHVIIQGNGKDIPEATIIEGAMLAAYYSKGRQSSQVPVNYTKKKHVRKPKGSKPGFVIYDNHKTLYVTPSEEPLYTQT